MSLRSDNWHGADPAVHAFYHNFTLKNCLQTRFYNFQLGAYWATTNGMQMMAYNTQFQQFTGGSYDNNFVALQSSNFWGDPTPCPPNGAYYYYFGWYAWTQWNKAPVVAAGHEKLKVRRTYWTGKPRRRMNI